MAAHMKKRFKKFDDHVHLLNSPDLSALNGGNEEDSDTSTEPEIGTDLGANAWKWHSKENVPKINPFTGDPGCKLPHLNSNSSPLEIFLEFWTTELIDKIVEETNVYADFCLKTNKTLKKTHSPMWTPVTADEIRAFLALSLIMGVVKKPELDMYWSRNPFHSTPFFANTVPRSRFRDIYGNLHFNSHQNDNKTDMLHDIRPVVETLQEKFKTVYMPTQNISISESLKFPGRVGFTNFGVKFYKLNQSDGPASGYTWNFKVHTDEDRNRIGNAPARSQVVMNIARGLLGFGYNIFVGDWYSTPDLFAELHRQGTNVCGTVKMGRRNLPPDLRNIHVEKGQAAFQSSHNNMLCLLWKDKKTTNILSTMHTSEMWSTGKIDKRTNQPAIKPKCLIDYNDGMGGSDFSDLMAASCKSVRKCPKWYNKIFYHLLDLTIINSFLVSRFLGSNLNVVDFKMSLIRLLIESSALPSYQNRAPSRSYPGPERLSGQHFLEPIPTTKKRKYPSKRCEVCKTHNKRAESRYQCEICKMPLCIHPCYKDYHTKQIY